MSNLRTGESRIDFSRLLDRSIPQLPLYPQEQNASDQVSSAWDEIGAIGGIGFIDR